MPALLVALVLTTGPGPASGSPADTPASPAPTDVKRRTPLPVPPAPPDDSATRAAPAPPTLARTAATRRAAFFGALVGGAVGLGAPLLLIPLMASCPGCDPTGAIALGTLAILTSMSGAVVGDAIAGGEGSVGAAAVGTVAGLLAALAVSSLVGVSSPRRLPEGAVAATLVTAGGLVVAAQAVALLVRGDALAEQPVVAAKTVRMVIPSLTLILCAGVTALLTGLAWVSSPALGIVTALALGGLTPLASWGAHRALGGRGSVLAAYLGTVAVAALGVVGSFVAMVMDTRMARAPGDASMALRTGTIAALAGGSVLVGALAVPVALELSHGLELEHTSAPDRGVSLGGGPVPGGAMVTVGARF